MNFNYNGKVIRILILMTLFFYCISISAQKIDSDCIQGLELTQIYDPTLISNFSFKRATIFNIGFGDKLADIQRKLKENLDMHLITEIDRYNADRCYISEQISLGDSITQKMVYLSFGKGDSGVKEMIIYKEAFECFQNKIPWNRLLECSTLQKDNFLYYNWLGSPDKVEVESEIPSIGSISKYYYYPSRHLIIDEDKSRSKIIYALVIRI